MSDVKTLNRRKFLIVGGAFCIGSGLGVGASLLFDRKPPALEERVAATPNPAVQQLPQDLIDALHAFIIERYDVALQRRQEVAAETRTRLETALAQHKLDASIAGTLSRFEDVPALASFFSNHNLVFRRQATNRIAGYELISLSPPEQRTLALFGKEHTVTFRRVLKELIPHSTVYASKHMPIVPVQFGVYQPKTKIIELNPVRYHEHAEFFHTGYTKEHQRIATELGTPDFLDQFVEPGQNGVTLKPEFLQHLGSQLRYVSIKQLYDACPAREAFILRVLKDYEEDILWHEAMHALDRETGDWAFLDQCGPGLKRELEQRRALHLEQRAFLSSLAHGHGLRVLAEIVKSQGYATDAKNDPHQDGADALLKNILKYLVTNRTRFPSLTFKRPGAHQIFKQFPKLTETDVREIARGVLAMEYKGRNLADYTRSFMPEKR